MSVWQTKSTLHTAVRGCFSWNIKYMHCTWCSLLVGKILSSDWRIVMFLHRSNLASSCGRQTKLFSSLLLWQLTVKLHILRSKLTKKQESETALVAVCFCNQEQLNWSDFKIDFSATKSANKTNAVNPIFSAPQRGLCRCWWLSRLVSLCKPPLLETTSHSLSLVSASEASSLDLVSVSDWSLDFWTPLSTTQPTLY